MSIKRAVYRFMILIGISWLIVSCASSGYDANRVYYEKEGNTKMGVRYLLGRGLPQNNEKAFYYFNRAAKEDDAFAQNELAYLYAAGKGTSQSYQQAFIWYQRAAKHGLASAQYNLGLMYLHGLGTAPNRTLAMQWIKKSAAHGFLPARKAIGSA